MKKILALFVFISFAISASVEGWIYNLKNKEPVPGVKIVIGEKVFTSEKNGHFTVPDLSPGNYVILFTHQDFQDESLKVTVPGNKIIRVYMIPIYRMKELVVTATLENKNRIDNPVPSTVVNKKTIEEENPIGIQDILKTVPGVSISSTGQSSIRPVVRGLYDYHVLTLLDGIPTVDMRSGGNHLLLVFPEEMEKVEVIRGPSSVLYGSNAIAGVVNFITFPENPFHSDKIRTKGKLRGLFSTMGNSRSGDMEFSLGKNSFFVDGRYGRKSSDDISDPLRTIPNTSYSAYFLDLFSSYESNKYQGKLVFHRIDGDFGVPINPSFTLSRFENSYFNYFKFSNTLKFSSSLLSSIDANVYLQEHQRNFHIEKPLNSSNNEDMKLILNVKSRGIQIVARSFPSDETLFHVGLDFLFQKATSLREGFLIDSQGKKDQQNLPRIIPDSERKNIGAFIEGETDLDKVDLFYGLRYDWIRVSSFLTENSPVQPSRNRNNSWSGNLGAILRLGKASRLNLHLGRAFRAPGILELYFYGPHQQTMDIGNPDLRPEHSFNADVGFSYSSRNHFFSISLFRNMIYDYVYKVRTGQVEEGMDVFTWKNVSKALLRGAELEVQLYPEKYLSLYSNASWVLGDDVNEGKPLQDIPPLNGSFGAKYDNGIWDFEFYSLWAAAQRRIAPFETETDGFIIFNLSGGVELVKGLRINLKGRNLLNTKYQNHLSRIKEWYYEPGRNFSISLSFEF